MDPFLEIALWLIVYVYKSYALMTIGKRLKYDKSWFAWIPFFDLIMILELGRFQTYYIGLMLFPLFYVFLIAFNLLSISSLFVGFVALLSLIVFAGLILSSWYRIAEKIKVIPPWTIFLIFAPIIGQIWFLIFMGLLAWKK